MIQCSAHQVIIEPRTPSHDDLRKRSQCFATFNTTQSCLEDGHLHLTDILTSQSCIREDEASGPIELLELATIRVLGNLILVHVSTLQLALSPVELVHLPGMLVNQHFGFGVIQVDSVPVIVVSSIRKA